MFNHTKILIGIVLLACIVVIGCGPGPYKPTSDPGSALEHSERVVLLDSKLKDWVRIDDAAKQFTSDDRLIAYVEIRNRRDKNLIVQVQTVFKDRTEMAMTDESTWQTIVIPQAATHYYKLTAYTPDAQDFVTRIKLAK